MLAADNATPFAVVVHGAFINAARLALETSADHPINTLPGVDPIEDTKVYVIPSTVTVSFAVGFVAKANTAEQVRLLVEYNLNQAILLK